MFDSENEITVIDLNHDLCRENLENVLEYIDSMQNDPRIQSSIETAAFMADGYFNIFWDSENRAGVLLDLSYLAIDLLVNISHFLDRVKLQMEMEK